MFRRRRRLGVGATVILVLSAVLAVVDTGPTSPVQAATTSMLSSANLKVIADEAPLTAITEFKYIINADNTGTTEQRSPSDGCSPEDPDYPTSCHWTSMGIASSSPIVTQGDQSDFVDGIVLPSGRYLISVLADGYKLDGQHFTMPLGVGEQVVVQLTKPPVPPTTIQAAVFEDISPVNSGADLPAEHGLAGFSGVVRDTLGDVTTDVFGDPLCGNGSCLSYCYVVDNGIDLGITMPINAAGVCPTVSADLGPLDPTGLTYAAVENPVSGVQYAYDHAVPSTAAIEGKVKIPNLGTNRFTLTVNPPDGSDYVQTTTLEGNHDWDSWVTEGATGLDTEFVVAGEPFPAIIFGYVHGGYSTLSPDANTATITGTVDKYRVYVPSSGGLPIGGDIFGGLSGGKLDGPIVEPWVALSSLGNGDTAVAVVRGDADGHFSIPNVPDGAYTLTWWDDAQDYILAIQNVTIVDGETVDVGILPLTGWWTEYSGFVFDDANRNGKMDWTDANNDGCPQVGEGELGVPNYGITMRRRENTLMDRGTTAASTDSCGRYFFESAYPMTQWLVMEAYNDLYYTTGVTYQADNQPTPTTVLGAGVDVNTLPIIGLSGTLDWGVHPYDPTGVTNGVDPQNGGIVGSVSYDTTRNELDPRYAAVEDWQPGVPDLTVELYSPVECAYDPDTGEILASQFCDTDGYYQLNADGSYMFGQKLNTYQTETWAQPGDNADGTCIPRDVDGNPLGYPAGQQITNDPTDCFEAPLMGVQFQQGYSSVDGNFGFGDGCLVPNHLDPTDASVCLTPDDQPTDFEALPGASDYLVHIAVPDDIQGRPLYKFTREEDINIGNGDEFIAPQVPPPACVGALHTVDVAGIDAAGNLAYLPNGDPNPAFTTDGPDATVNLTFLDIGGSPYEGMQKPICDTKLVPLNNGKSVAPLFNVFTDVPIPGHFWGLLVDDLNFSSTPQSFSYGEKAGVPFAPVGIYDYKNRLVQTVESDFNGLFDVLMPSTNRINCPTPSGICANVYRFVGNDPGTPGNLNLNYKPSYRTIAAEFESIPGNTIPADLAPTQVGVTVQLPGGQAVSVECAAPVTVPQLYAVSAPFVRDTGSRSFTIKGVGFGQQAGTVTLDGTVIPASAWTDAGMTATVPTTIKPGPYQLAVHTATGLTTVNGLTFHVLATSVPQVYFSTDNSNTPNGAGGSGDDADIYRWNGGNSYSRIIDASVAPYNPPMGSVNVDGYSRIDDTNFYVSFSNSVTISGLGTVQDEDVVRYTAPVAPATRGTWSMFFDGSARGLSASTDLDAIDVVAGMLYFSTDNTNTPPGVAGAGDDSDIYSWNPLAGQDDVVEPPFARVVDASSSPYNIPNGGGSTANANVDGLTFVDANDFYVSFSNSVLALPGLPRIADESIAHFSNGTWSLYFDGSTHGLGGNFDLDAISVPLGTGGAASLYAPNVYEVGPGVSTTRYRPANTLPGSANHAIQNALDDAAASPGDDLVVVYPGVTSTDRINPRGAYYENLIIAKGVKLQGVGSGSPDGSVRGSIIDGGAFGGDSPVAADWRSRVADPVNWDGNQTVYDGAVISIYTHQGDFKSDFKASIDGFDLRGANQEGFPNNINPIGGGATGQPGGLITQGGAIFVNAHADNLQITNNVVQNNGGAYGTIRIGTPDISPAQNANPNIRIANNRIVANAGTNLAGGIGIFAGADNYTIADNDICGNFSAEYGGGITAYGLSPNGTIDHNRIWFNQSYDEGGGIMIAGTLPADPNVVSSGSGAVTISRNVIQSNLSNDDGGGLRFLMAGTEPMTVENNMITNNVSTHEGGGVGINDTTNIRFVNNTVMKNVTTATAVTSNGQPAPAGLSTSKNSDALQATGEPLFSNPVLFNNIFWDNRAGTRSLDSVTGLGAPGDINPIVHWDMGVAEVPGALLSPTNSVLQTTTGTVTTGTPNNVGTDPNVVSPYDTVVSFNGWRTNPNFIGAILISLDLPPDLLGNYHLQPGSPAIDAGASVGAPTIDIGGDVRPTGASVDIGADESTAPSASSFPSTPVLDNFNRRNSANLGADWLGSNAGYRVNSSTLEIRANAAPPKPKLWARPLGGNQEAYFTFTDVSAVASEQGLVLRSNTAGDSLIKVVYNRSTNEVSVVTVGAGAPTTVLAPVTFVNGDNFGARVQDTTVTVYRNGSAIGTAQVNTWNGTGTNVGVWFAGTNNTNNGNARIDNFGGGGLL